jgi:hypothetical protein
MKLENLLHEVQFVVDAEGQRTAVQLDLALWEEIIDRLTMTEQQPANGMNELDEAQYQEEMDELNRLLEACAVETGIPDLAQEHDHYLYGTPKRASS